MRATVSDGEGGTGIAVTLSFYDEKKKQSKSTNVSSRASHSFGFLICLFSLIFSWIPRFLL